MTAINSDPGWNKGTLLTAQQWNALWAGKADGNNGQAQNLLIMGGTVQGTVTASGIVEMTGAWDFSVLTLDGVPVLTDGQAVTSSIGGTISDGTLTLAPYGTVTVSGSSATINPAGLDAALVVLPAGTVTININAGYVNDRFRCDFKMPSSGTAVVVLGTSVVTGTTVPGYTCSGSGGLVDEVLFRYNGATWRLEAVNLGFAG